MKDKTIAKLNQNKNDERSRATCIQVDADEEIVFLLFGHVNLAFTALFVCSCSFVHAVVQTVR